MFFAEGPFWVPGVGGLLLAVPDGTRFFFGPGVSDESASAVAQAAMAGQGAMLGRPLDLGRGGTNSAAPRRRHEQAIGAIMEACEYSILKIFRFRG